MKRPWNLIDGQVYSLATYSDEGVNMNIISYVTAVSMKPKRYTAAIYHDTKTLDNMRNTDYAILQFLSVHHLTLIRSLGKKSGFDFNKEAYLRDKDLLTKWKNYEVLKDCTALIKLKKIDSTEAGDHELFLFDVEKYETFQNPGQLLRLNHLRENQIISI